eukprot:4541232-Pyramimonas_sp.AAC.1
MTASPTPFPLHVPLHPRSGQLPWASVLDGLVGLRITSRIADPIRAARSSTSGTDGKLSGS